MPTFALSAVDQHAYYAFPTIFVTNKAYRDLGLSAALAYTFMLDRTSLSRANHKKWEDDQGIFIRVRPKAIIDFLSCAWQKMRGIMDNLQRVNLLIEQDGHIYLCKTAGIVDGSNDRHFHSKHRWRFDHWAIPKALFAPAYRHVPDAAKVLWAYLRRMASSEGRVTCTKGNIAETLGLDRKTVATYLKILAEVNLLQEYNQKELRQLDATKRMNSMQEEKALPTPFIPSENQTQTCAQCRATQHDYEPQEENPAAHFTFDYPKEMYDLVSYTLKTQTFRFSTSEQQDIFFEIFEEMSYLLRDQRSWHMVSGWPMSRDKIRKHLAKVDARHLFYIVQGIYKHKGNILYRKAYIRSALLNAVRENAPLKLILQSLEMTAAELALCREAKRQNAARRSQPPNATPQNLKKEQERTEKKERLRKLVQ